jgi:hypothetical protein
MQNPFEVINAKLDQLLEHQQAPLTSSSLPPTEVINEEVLCQRLGITHPTAIRWRQRGKIPFLQIGSAIRYDWQNVLKSLEQKRGGVK